MCDWEILLCHLTGQFVECTRYLLKLKQHQRAAAVAQNVSDDQVRCCTCKQQMLALTLSATLNKLDGGASGP